MKKFKHSILGGTFDHFHIGHQALLDAAYAESERVTIGLTTEKFYQHKFLAESIENYEIRETNLKTFLQIKNYTEQTRIMKLTDIYGPALTEKNIEAIFVTEDSLLGAKKINEERVKIGFLPLETIIVPFINATDTKPITSERIRLGEIDTNGHMYADIFSGKTRLTLPKSLRETLRTPIGEIFRDTADIVNSARKAFFVIAVGDIVTLNLRQNRVIPQIALIDLKTRREHIAKQDQELLLLTIPTPFTNHAGEINTQIAPLLTNAIQQGLSNKLTQTILINGEEDLLTLPAILLAPLDSIIIYGQYNMGAVVVQVTSEKKQFVNSLLAKFGF